MSRDSWIKVEWYTSPYGSICSTNGGEWVGRVNLPNNKQGRLAETFVSAEVAMREVEKRWEKENKG